MKLHIHSGLRATGSVCLLVLLLAVPVHGICAKQLSKPKAASTNSAAEASSPLRILQLREDVYLLAGAGANIVVQIGPQGALVVDTGNVSHAAQVLEAIRKLTAQPIRYIFNTSAAANHVGGNEVLSKAGEPFGQSSSGPNAPPAPAPIVATLATLQHMSTEGYAEGAWPTQTLFNQKLKTLYLNGQGIEMIDKGGAHSDADAVVLFRRSDVLVSGEIFDITRFPLIDVEKGGSIQGEIDALNDLIDLAIPNTPLTWLEGGTLVVPARGRVCQQAELVEYRDMLTIIRDRVQDLIKQDKTLEQIKQANPTADYAPRYGATSGAWTTQMFVEAVYRSLANTPRTTNAL